MDVLQGQIGIHLYLRNPRVVEQGLASFPLLSCGSHVDERCGIFRLFPIELRRVPKVGNFTVSNGDGGDGIE
jgi:hypothetical protein